MVIKNFRHSMLNYYYLIGQLVVPLGSTFYFPPMLNYFTLAEFGLRAALCGVHDFGCSVKLCKIEKRLTTMGMFTNSAESFILFYYLKTGFQLTKI